MSAACPELGFRLVVSFANGTPQPTIEACRSVFEYDVLDRNSLFAIDLRSDYARRRSQEPNGETFSAVGARDWGYIVQREGDQATEADRKMIRDWIVARFEDATITVGPIVDLSEG